MRVSVITYNRKQVERDFVEKLVDELKLSNIVYLVNINDWEPWQPYIKLSDVVISIGGDGTLLHIVSKMGNVQIPILGVNFGTVGFLTDMEQSHAIENIKNILNNPIKIEKRNRIDIVWEDTVLGTALNDIVIKSDSNMVKVAVTIDNVVATSFKGDGLIIATPTGSTAYALSSGGPIVDPRTEGFLLVPIAPYLLSSRPQIVHGSRKLIVNADGGSIIIDGKKATDDIREHQSFELKISEHPALLVDIGRNFFEKVNTKLKVL